MIFMGRLQHSVVHGTTQDYAKLKKLCLVLLYHQHKRIPSFKSISEYLNWFAYGNVVVIEFCVIIPVFDLAK